MGRSAFIAAFRPVTARPALAALLLAASALAPRPAAAAFNYPWCALYAQSGGVRSCAFATFEQCLDTVRGIGGYCAPNPLIAPAPPAPLVLAEPRRAKKARRRHARDQ